MGVGTVVRQVRRVEPDVLAELGASGVATVHEAGATKLLPPEIRPIREGARVGGSAITVSCRPGDNIMIHAAVEVIEPGDVLVVGLTSPADNGMFGELLAVSVMARGCRGLVIDGGVRDVADLRGMGFPVWARTIHAAGTTKTAPGSVNLPIDCAGVRVSPGDVVVADDDGVAVVERQRAREVSRAARQRLLKEEEIRNRLRHGEMGLDIYGFRQRLQDQGIRWIDHPDE